MATRRQPPPPKAAEPPKRGPKPKPRDELRRAKTTYLDPADLAWMENNLPRKITDSEWIAACVRTVIADPNLAASVLSAITDGG